MKRIDICRSEEIKRIDIKREIPSTDKRKVEITFSARDHKAVACVYSGDGVKREIKLENMPKELREIRDPIVFGAFLRDAYAKTVTLSDGDVRLDVLQRIRGGMRITEPPVAIGESAFVAEGDLHIPEALVRRTIELTQSGLRQIDALDRQAVIILGPTGVGKSTLINILAGVRLVSVRDESTGVMRIEARDPLPDFRIGHDVASETTVPHKWKSPDGVVYWDCPGFIDNRGAEQQIANATFIKKLFDTPGIKILITLREPDLTDVRATPIISLVQQLELLFAGDVAQIKDSLSLVVSHTHAATESRHLQARIARIISSAPLLSDAQRILLSSLASKPISIIRTPSDEGDVDVSTLGSILSDVEAMKYAEGVRVKIALPPQAQLVALASYTQINSVLDSQVRRFIDTFRDHVQTIATNCKDKVQLKSLVVDLNATLSDNEFSIQNMHSIVDRCKLIVKTYGDGLEFPDLETLDNVLAKIESIKFFEQFLETRSHIPLQIVHNVRSQIADMRVVVEKSIIDIEVAEAISRADAAETDKRAAMVRLDIAEATATEARQRALGAEEATATAQRSLATVMTKIDETQRQLIEQQRATVAAEERAKLEAARHSAEEQKRAEERKKEEIAQTELKAFHEKTVIELAQAKAFLEDLKSRPGIKPPPVIDPVPIAIGGGIVGAIITATMCTVV